MKRPAGPTEYHCQVLAVDQWGTWLHLPRGFISESPDGSETEDIDAVALLDPAHPWVPWWVDRPEGRSLEVDVCLPPVATSEGWSYVDLELDVRGDELGFVRLEDEDEFQAACEAGWISAEEAELATAAAHELEVALRRGREPFGATGWARLIQAVAKPR
jgi:hypothetical protein